MYQDGQLNTADRYSCTELLHDIGKEERLLGCRCGCFVERAKGLGLARAGRSGFY